MVNIVIKHEGVNKVHIDQLNRNIHMEQAMRQHKDVLFTEIMKYKKTAEVLRERRPIYYMVKANNICINERTPVPDTINPKRHTLEPNLVNLIGNACHVYRGQLERGNEERLYDRMVKKISNSQFNLHPEDRNLDFLHELKKIANQRLHPKPKLVEDPVSPSAINSQVKQERQEECRRIIQRLLRYK